MSSRSALTADAREQSIVRPDLEVRKSTWEVTMKPGVAILSVTLGLAFLGAPLPSPGQQPGKEGPSPTGGATRSLRNAKSVFRPRPPNECRSPSIACQCRIGCFAPSWLQPLGASTGVHRLSPVGSIAQLWVRAPGTQMRRTGRSLQAGRLVRLISLFDTRLALPIPEDVHWPASPRVLDKFL